jgi:hypothetical protein
MTPSLLRLSASLIIVIAAVVALFRVDGARFATLFATGPVADSSAAPSNAGAIPITGPSVIVFLPVLSDAQLDADPALATLLDDVAVDVGTAVDSLTGYGVAAHYALGEPIRWEAAGRVEEFRRDLDSALVGTIWIDGRGAHEVRYGRMTRGELIAAGRAMALRVRGGR